MPMGYGKPFVVVVPFSDVRRNRVAPYEPIKERFAGMISKTDQYGCLRPSSWCVTESYDIILQAINRSHKGETSIFNGTWSSYE